MQELCIISAKFMLILRTLLGYRCNDKIAEDEVWLFGGFLLLVEELLPIGFAYRVGEFGLGLTDSVGERGREVALVWRNLLRVLVLGIVRDDFLTQTDTIIGLTGAVSAPADVVDGVMKGCLCHSV